MLTLSILDQSPISYGSNAREALQQTVELAQVAEKLGYKRFWVSEHHDSTTLAGSTPEVLIAHLAAKTNHIRIGSGGVMLPHYSAYKVAENFRMLEALYPERIDLGVGRAPGGMPRATIALNGDRRRNVDQYPDQVAQLKAYLTDTLPTDHPLHGLKVSPLIDTVPKLWLLGSSGGSAAVAAEQGAAYAFAHFINGEGGQAAVQAYKERFQPSAFCEQPQASVAVFVICADTDEAAERIASSLDLSLLMLESGQPSLGTPPIEMAEAYAYSPFERARVAANRQRMVVGSPRTVKDELTAMAAAYGVEEVIAVTITYRHEDRLRSYELLADAF
ncbi:LLM class flavin-dependent oxidoreductase [Numidum massiliense]|uniref:LLM class flavin-dependent oxidoreductase n=1 Tax=Numidum massiliense TaxID=1522315 RepID=UPI0006D5900D|nr:LLM class flavin-dependent oxidoreductase [Numidum massiliense]